MFEKQYFVSNTAIELQELNSGVTISTIEVLRAGKLLDRNFTITTKMLEAYVQNFKDNVIGNEIPVNLSHKKKEEAAGWILELFIEDDVLLARVEWTPLGIRKVQGKEFKFTSSEVGSEMHHETRKKVDHVLSGVALTNIPAVRAMKAIALNKENQANIHNHNNMEILKKLHATFLAKESLTSADSHQFSEVADAAVAADESVKEEAETMKAEVEAKATTDEAAAEKAAGENDEAAAEEAKAELAKKEKKEKTLLARVEAMEAENKDMSRSLAKQDLEKSIRTDLCITEERPTGFASTDENLATVSEFMLDLTQTQKEEFKKILGLVQTVDLSVRGLDEKATAVNETLKEKIELAKKEAQKMSEETGEELHACLSKVFEQKGLTEEA